MPEIILIQIFQLPDSLIEISGFVKKKGEDVTSPMVAYTKTYTVFGPNIDSTVFIVQIK